MSIEKYVKFDKFMLKAYIVFGVIHLMLFTWDTVLLQGHKYGSPDKYGDYARGLTSSDVDSIESLIFFLILIPVVLLLFNKLFIAKGKKLNFVNDKWEYLVSCSNTILGESVKPGTTSCSFYRLLLIIIMFIGAILNILSYSMFN